ncbi:uncharacterized protein LOC111027499 [Myzus persicae]|uniref:uncharacterized protein LOC111027499 n=1 Tax=Myzus persicae TaxID=13164 RepID=UPI000B9352D4|nr:uncharacterized protein LOC111027499 [Myzus persicae]
MLQGDKHMNFGFLLPTIEELSSKFTLMSRDDTISKSIQPLVSALLTGINKRFGDLLQNKFLIIASVSNPYFKVAWIKNDVRKQMAMDAFRNACLQIYEKECVSNTQEPNIVESYDEPSLDFFTWSSSNNMNGIDSVDIEINHYFRTSPTKNLDCLQSLPILKKVFIKYNTPLPSSASVERVFSVGGATLTKKRTSISDKHFEQIMFLKCNNQCNNK